MHSVHRIFGTIKKAGRISLSTLFAALDSVTLCNTLCVAIRSLCMIAVCYLAKRICYGYQNFFGWFKVEAYLMIVG